MNDRTDAGQNPVHAVVRHASDIAAGQLWSGRSKPRGLKTTRKVVEIRRLDNRGMYVHWENSEANTEGVMKLSSFRTWADELV